jgi:two-component system, cell cycle response regulator
MYLRRQLTLFFILILALPLAAAAFVIQRVVAGELQRRALLSLRPALSVAHVVLEDRRQSIDQQVAGSLDDPALVRALEERKRAAVRILLANRLDSRYIDFLIALDDAGNVLTHATEAPDFVPGSGRSSPHEILAAGPGGSGLVKTGPIAIGRAGDEPVGTVVGGFWIDRDVLIGSTDRLVELAVVVDGRVVASTRPLTGPAKLKPAHGRFPVDIAGGGTAQAAPVGEDTHLVVWAPSSSTRELASRFAGSLFILLAIALVATAVLAYLLARRFTQPLTEVARGAKAIAEGRFDHRINVRSRGEIGQLAESFNNMSDHLEELITELSASRGQLQRAVQRVGELFRSTHDMEHILGSILETAADAVDADAAILWRFNPTRSELYPALTRGLGGDVPNVAVGAGVAGTVAERGTPLLKEPNDDANLPVVPNFPAAVAAAFRTRNRIQGVIVCYRRESEKPFTHEDLSTVVFLAEQGGVAIENVALHEEAQRLSLTDGLTGTWNRRYFQMQFRQVLATSVRFERPFSILMLDLDHFKRINDTFGHQRGDATLIELTQRVTKVLREVDTFARYGGEEFICLLPETDYAGALVTSEKILDAVKGEPFGETGEQLAKLTVSIGVASYPIHGVSFSLLVEAADQALYRAKQEGRDRVIVAGQQPPNLTLAK